MTIVFPLIIVLVVFSFGIGYFLGAVHAEDMEG